MTDQNLPQANPGEVSPNLSGPSGVPSGQQGSFRYGRAPVRRHGRRGWWVVGAVASLVALAIAVGVVDMNGSYDADDTPAMCKLVDPAPLRKANPHASKQKVRKEFSDSGVNGFLVGAEMRYCVLAYVDGQSDSASAVRVVAAYYSNQRDAALAYNEMKLGDIGDGLNSDVQDDYAGPALPDPLTNVKVGAISAARGVDAPEAFCAPIRQGYGYERFAPAGYVVAARDSNLLFEVFVALTGDRMDLGRRRWAAATIAAHTLTELRD